MKLRLALLMSVVSLVGAAPATAHPTTWYWSLGLAQQRLEEEGIKWSNRPWDAITLARCYGIAPSIPDRKHRYERLYKHMRCHIYLEDLDAGGYWVKFHVTGRNTWTVTWIRWGD